MITGPDVVRFNGKHNVLLVAPPERDLFVAAIERALAAPQTDEIRQRRRDIAALSSWDSRIMEMSNLIEEREGVEELTLNGIAGQVAQFTAWIRRSRRLNKLERPVNVNLGSGLKVAPGWINVEGGVHALIAPFPRRLLRIAHRFTGSSTEYAREQYVATLKGHRFVHHDLRYGIPFEDGQVDHLYLPDVLVHFSTREALALFLEAHRVLRLDGLLRISTQDLDKIFATYRSGDVRATVNQIFGSGDRHHWHPRKAQYDFRLLEQLLREAGFSKVTRYERGEGSMLDREFLDGDPSESLYLEARP